MRFRSKSFLQALPAEAISLFQGLDALLKAPAGKEKRWRGPYIKEAPIDPWGNPYQYRFPGARNISGQRSFDIWSLGLDGVESGDDIGNWTKQ